MENDEAVNGRLLVSLLIIREFNSFTTEADIILKPVYWFALQMISASVMKELSELIKFYFSWNHMEE